jgi:hypothetical protein
MSAVSSTYSSTLVYALIEERHFALLVALRFSNLGSLLNRSGQELGPTQPSLRSLTAIKIRLFELPRLLGAGCPIITSVIYLLTIEISGLSRVSVRACGPQNLMKMAPSRMQNRTGWERRD